MTVLDILNGSARRLRDHQIESPRLNVELLLGHSLGVSRERLYMDLRREMQERERQVFEGMVERRLSGEPLQYILGRQEFWSMEFSVDPDVLIPRPETELLVEQALAVLSEIRSPRRPMVLDLGTGSGIVAIVLAKEIRDILVVATDISREALALARKNAVRTGVDRKIAFVQGDLFHPIRPGKGPTCFDLILSNPPYVRRPVFSELAREVREHEPRIALDGGEDGLRFYPCIAAEAASYLRPGGWLLLEVGEGQGPAVSEWIRGTGRFSEPGAVRDLAAVERVVKAQKKRG